MFARVPLSVLRSAGIAVIVAMPLLAQSAPKKPSRAKAVAGKIVDTTATSAATIAADSLLGSRGAAMTQALQAAQSAQMSAAYAAAAGVPQCASGTFPVPVVMGGAGAPTPAGTGVAGAATAAAAAALPSIPSVPTPGGLVVGLAKKKLFGFGKKKDTAQAPAQASAIPPAATTAGDGGGRAQFQCMTVEQAQAYQQAVQSGTNASMMSALAGSAASTAANQSAAANAQKDVMKTAAATALAVSPAGMMVTGAAAAAPTAGKALHALGSRFGRGGQNKESMQKDLAGGRLELKAIRFAAGSDDPSEGFDQTLATVVQAIQGASGHFVLVVPAERDESAGGAVNVELAQRRTMRLAMHLALAGVPEALLTAGDPAQPNVGGDKPPKAGDARPLILRAAVAQP